MKSTYQPQSIRNKSSRKSFNIDSFGGVDYSTQKFNVATHRAIDELNYVYKDGVVQKRNGLEEFFEVKPIKYYVVNFDDPKKDTTQDTKTNSTIIYDMWNFLAEDGKWHLIAHIGKLLCEIKNLGKSNMTIEAISYNKENSDTHPHCYEFLEQKTDGFVGGNKFWFLGGTKYMLLRFKSDGTYSFNPVEDLDNVVAIPTTTLSITYADAKASARASYDNVNLLSRLRKNKLMSGVGKLEGISTTEEFKYTLDSPIITKSNNTTELENDFYLVIEKRGDL